MKNPHPPENQRPRRIALRTWATVLAVALTIALPQAAAYDDVIPPRVPENLEVPAGNTAFLIGRAYGTQNYICLPSASGFTWAFFGPQATLFNADSEQVITHFLSPNPVENGTPRPTWQHSHDTSRVWAAAIGTSSERKFVAPGAIPWLLLQVTGAQYGPDSGDELTATTFIQRVNTAGGIAPATGCTLATDVGKKALVPYAADYVFYKSEHGDGEGAR